MKSVLILGAGISGLGAAHVLLRHDVKVLISDLKDSIHDKKEKRHSLRWELFSGLGRSPSIFWTGWIRWSFLR